MRSQKLAMGALAALFLSCGSVARIPTTAVGASSYPEPVDPALAEDAPPAPPFQLTASDGTGLKLISVRAAASIDDPLALTQVHLVFGNPEARTLEGRFTFTLPEGAAMSRFAMKVRGAWQEAEVVEKQRARVTYEEFLHRRVDPALLEQGAGNEFSVRIFPIGPNEQKELIVTYSETLDTSVPYRLRLAGLPPVPDLRVDIFSGGSTLESFARYSSTAPADVVVPLARWYTGAAVGLRAGSSMVARVRVPEGDAPKEEFSDTVVLVDTSASRALDLGREIAALRAVVKTMPADARVRIACFDQAVVSVYDGEAGKLGETALDKIRAHRALGASDLEGALRWVERITKSDPAGTRRLVLLGDGVATAGETDPIALSKIAGGLSKHGFVRADAVAIGGIRNDALLSAIVKEQLPSAGMVIGLDRGIEEVVSRLSKKTLAPMPISVPGASWSYPKSLLAQPGDDVVVYADIGNEKTPKVHVGEVVHVPQLRTGVAPLVERAMAVAKIAEAESEDEATAEARKAEVIALSTKHRVVSRHTSMLVLETDMDYERFKIDRTAKLEILGIDGGKVALASHVRGKGAQEFGMISPAPTAVSGNMWGSEIGDSFGAGGLGLSGIGAGGGGNAPGLGNIGTIGHGAGAGTGQGFGAGASTSTSGRTGGTHRSKPPQVRMGATSVSGRLPAEVIQRIVRQNFGRFRGCYQAGLLGDPSLAGRVSVKFVIGRDGSVSGVSDNGSTLSSADVRRCVLKAFYGLTFPQPEGGVVTVVYPLVFSPEGDTAPPPSPLPIQSPRRLPQAPTPSSPPEPSSPRTASGLEITKDPYEGPLSAVMAAIEGGKDGLAMHMALQWRVKSPGDVLSFVALGEAAEARGELDLAARAYGSILELWSYRVDMRRFAGERLERIGSAPALALADDAYEGAIADRPDHPSSHRLRAMTLLKLDRPAEAFQVLEKALTQTYASGRYGAAMNVLREDLGTAAAAWLAVSPEKKEDIEARVTKAGASIERSPSLRFVLVWETDTSDVDLHVIDATGDRAFHGDHQLDSGGRLSEDVTNGYGPEAFAVVKDDGKFSFPYKLQVQYYARGSMGFGMGKVQIVRHDGAGKLRFEERPFVLMKERATLDLGTVTKL